MLDEKLQNTLNAAGANTATPLHQFIVGPPQSGRTTQAEAYAQALVARGWAGNAQNGAAFYTLSFRDVNSPSDVAEAFAAAMGGVLVIDHLAGTIGAATAAQQALRARMIEAFDLKQLTLVFISTPRDLADAMREMPELSQRLRTTVNMPHTLSPAEIAQYHADTAASDLRRRRIAEWKIAKDQDLRPQDRIAAPHTARFTRPGGGA
ncbi:MAG TPA: ATP-binding protein [Patescibacteria group bacterium]|nr:ATP-binding protein [Patescibacteria group bacterium]